MSATCVACHRVAEPPVPEGRLHIAAATPHVRARLCERLLALDATPEVDADGVLGVEISPSLAEHLAELGAELSAAELQDTRALVLPFGAIRLDREGNVLSFNQYESELTGRHRDRVIGRNFFTEVAPCTNVREFAGRFRAGVALGQLHEVFPYRFDFEMAPRDVTVTLFYSDITGSAWVFVREVKD